MVAVYYTSFTTELRGEKSWWKRLLTLSGICFIALVLASSVVAWTLERAPDPFPAKLEVTIEPGTSVNAIGEKLEQAGVIRESWWFLFRVIAATKSVDLQAGTYRFEEPFTVGAVIDRLRAGDVVSNDVTITLVEGKTREIYAKQLAAELPAFERIKFMQHSADLEGYLFPDTYKFTPDTTAREVVNKLHATFNDRFASLEANLTDNTLAKNETVILASILEREANSTTSMRMVSGVLHNRLDINMPLQADATMEYVLDKPLADLTPEDLEIDTPYNTYLNRGLPPTPIGNPGREALTAAMKPAAHDFLYYITGDSGRFHYATTYTEHQENIARYLR
jgi:UPF0755 protein